MNRDTDNLIKFVRKHGGDWLVPGRGIPVMTGKRDGATVDAGFGRVWVRYSNGEEKAVLNNGAPLAFDWHVTINHKRNQPSVWMIQEVRQVYNETPPSFVQAHASQHYMGGFDELDIDRRQVLSASLFVANSTGFLVRVYGGLFPIPGGWVLGQSTNGTTVPDIDLSSYLPTAGAQYVSIEHDGTGEIVINDSAPVRDAPESLNPQTDVAVVPAGSRLVGFVMLYASQPKLLNKHIYLPGLYMTDYAAVETGYQINNAPAGTPVNPDKFGFWSVGDNALELVESLSINGVEEDPLVYSLSDDGTQIVLDTALVTDALIMAHTILEIA